MERHKYPRGPGHRKEERLRVRPNPNTSREMADASLLDLYPLGPFVKRKSKETHIFFSSLHLCYLTCIVNGIPRRSTRQPNFPDGRWHVRRQALFNRAAEPERRSESRGELDAGKIGRAPFEEVTDQIKALRNPNDFDGILRVPAARASELEVEIERIGAS